MKITREDHEFEDAVRFVVKISNAELASRRYDIDALLEKVSLELRALLEARG